MKHIVFLLGSYYPNYSAVGKCMGNIANILEDDYKITVISQKTQSVQMKNDHMGNQDIIRITTKYHEKRMINDECLKNSTGAEHYMRTIRMLAIKIENLLRTLCSCDTLDEAWVNAYICALRSIQEPIDILIPTCLPFESVKASIKYQTDYPEVEILPYLFDLFATNKNLNRFWWNLCLKKKNNLLLEKEMLLRSKKVFHVANWSVHLKEEFPEYQDKTIEVEHPLLVLKKNQVSRHIFLDQKIHIIYTGVLDVKNRNPNFALEILTKLPNNIVVDFYSYGSGNTQLEKTAKEFKDKIISHGKVSSAEAEQARAEGNILLSIGNNDVSQIPSKLFEYIATGKAIVHIALSPIDPAIKTLEKYPLKLILIKGKNYQISDVQEFIEKYQGTVIPFEIIVRDYFTAYPPKITDKIKQFIDNSDNSCGGGYRLVFAGSLLRGYVEADYVLKLFMDSEMENFNITFYSAGNACREVEKNQNRRISLGGWVSSDVLNDVYRSADGLISIAERKGKQISSKIFEYMSWGKPIIHFYFTDSDENLKYLREYPNALCLRASKENMQLNRTLIKVFVRCRRNIHFRIEDFEILKSCTPQCILSIVKKNF